MIVNIQFLPGYIEPYEEGTAPMVLARRTILHVIDTLEIGGAQRLLVLYAAWTPADRYRVVVCALQPGEDCVGALEASGAKVIRFNRTRPSIIWFPHFLGYVLRNVRDLCRICRRENVDVIHCHLSDAEFLGILAGRWCGVRRVITTLHTAAFLPSRSPRDVRNGLRVALTKRLYKKWVDRIVAVSADAAENAEALFALDPGKIQVIRNRIDVLAFQGQRRSGPFRTGLGVASDEALVVCVARLVECKGQRVLLDALSRLVRAGTRAKLLLVGDGEERLRLEQRSRDLGLTDHVIFLGNRADVADVLAVADAFVLPSLSEATSLALLEAMASGLPIVATSVPGNAAVIEHGVTGLLVPPGDDLLLAQAITLLLQDPERARELGEQAKRTAQERYDIPQSIDELEALWS